MKRKVNILRRVLILVLIILTIGFTCYKRFFGVNGSEEQFVTNSSNEEMINASVLGNAEIYNLRNYYDNDDINGKIVIDGTGIDEPILKYTDNKYYLNHDNYGNYNLYGSIYMDYRTSLGDRKILVYGHSSVKREVPFNELEGYYDRSFYDNHRYITIIGEEEIYKYEIFSVYVETADFTYMNLNIDNDTYNSYLNKYKEKSLYDTEVGVEESDNILILQTCSNNSNYRNYEKKYLLVIAKKVK